MPRTPLSPSEIKDFTHILKAQEAQWREAIHQSLLASGDKSHVALAGRVHDRAEESVSDLLADLQVGELASDVRKLAEVESALRRIADATYGLCSDCGQPIPLSRLMAYPAALRCVDCQARLEDRRGGRDATPSL
jgi:RNA polymerase-binding transcription factor DksA